jgi:hypothetical protein
VSGKGERCKLDGRRGYEQEGEGNSGEGVGMELNRDRRRGSN